MNAALEQEFIDKYPDVLKDIGTIDVGDGWRDLVTVICNYIELVNQVKGTDIHIVQLKEKFGLIRCYMAGDAPEPVWEAVNRAIRMVEDLSAKTCQDCGADGVPRRGGWVVVLCDEHSRGKKPLKTWIDNSLKQ